MGFQNNSTLESVTNLQLSWNHNNPMPIAGWALEIDSTNTFDSIDKRSATSGTSVLMFWQEATTSVTARYWQKWHWRVRDFQILISLEIVARLTFYLPDLNYHQIQSGLFSTEYSQNSAFSNVASLDYTELFVTDNIFPEPDNGASDTILTLGKKADGANSSILVSIPTFGIHPENASLISATFCMYATLSSSQNLAWQFEGLQPWNINANNKV